MLSAEDNLEGVIDYSAKFAPDSIVHQTWGAPRVEGIRAPTPIRRRRNFAFSRSGRQSAYDKFMFGERPTSASNSQPGISHLLRLPLETRLMIYEYLLVQQTPIMVHHDWVSLRGLVSLESPGILLACKQINQEATPIIYKYNVFQAAIRGERAIASMTPIDAKFLPLLRNVVLYCVRDKWNNNVLKRTILSLKSLISANVHLQTLTFVFRPQRVGVAKTLIGIERNPITYSDWFHPKSKLLLTIRSIRCTFLTFIIGLQDKKRVIFSIDLQYLPINCQAARDGPALDEVAAKTRVKRAIRVKREFQQLKERFELIFNNHEEAIMKGLARLMEDGEAVGDGIKLANRGT